MRTYNCHYCGKENKFKGVQYANKYCNNDCSSKHLTEQHKQKWYDGSLTKPIDRKTIYKYLAEDVGHKCSVCGISDWMGQDLVLQVDHIDGNAGDNSPSNVRLICPNCHSQQDNWGGRNRGNGRKSRGLSLR